MRLADEIWPSRTCIALTDGAHVVIVPLFASFVTTLFGLALALTAIFLILLVLVQRGRGGGLAGALGGMGGSSAFGAKAGDMFTRITIGAASVWIVLCIIAAKYSAPTSNLIDVSVDSTVNSTVKSDANSHANDSTIPPLGTENQQGKEGTTAASDSNSAKTPPDNQSPPSPE
jgi:preprotein translocase subunit SecG